MKQNPPPHGHRRKDAQAQFVLNREVHPLDQVNWPDMDAWLASALGLTPPWAQVKAQAQIDDVTVTNVALRAFALAHEMFKALRVPLFDPVLLLSVQRHVEQDRETLRMQALAPTLDHLPESLVSYVHQYCWRLMVSVAQDMAKGQVPDTEKIRAQVQQDLVKRLQATLPFGLSTVPILSQAWKDKIPFRHLGAGVFLLGWGAQARRIHRSSVGTDSAIGSFLAGNKLHTVLMLRGAGLPVPQHQPVKNLQEAQAAAVQLGWPVVIKPADRERSEGVSVRIQDEAGVERAYALAATFSRTIMVEQQIPGMCYRLMVANGRFLYALWRRPMAVVGDGVHSVADLLAAQTQAAEQSPPWSRDKAVPLDELTEQVLASQGLSAQSVPTAGQRVPVRFIESTEWGEDRGDATAQVHPVNVALAEHAARVLGLSNAGVDLISPDISVPWYDNGAAINEVNFAPHFGGTATARSHMPRFLAQWLEGQGRIPLEVFVGGPQALIAAGERQAQWRQQGLQAWLCSADETRSPEGAVEVMAIQGSFERTQALLSDSRVQALAVVVQDDQWLRWGAPVNRIDDWKACGQTAGLTAQAEAALHRFLNALK